MRTGLGLLLVPLIGYVVANAQVPSTAAPAFEVTSVKRNVSDRIGGAIRVPPAGTLSYTNVPLRVLIRDAYQVDPYAEAYKLDPGAYASLVGRSGGQQLDAPRFDVIAKPPANTQPADRRAMMRTLLEDRFQLRVHREMRQMPVYALTLAREGRVGPRLAPSKFDCRAYLAQRRLGGTAEEPLDASGQSWCLVRSSAGPMVVRSAGSVTALMQGVQPYIDRPIVDGTGLSGNFEWVLSFAPGLEPSADFPNIFTALREQLGLKLESRQAPVEVLVVDSVALPTAY